MRLVPESQAATVAEMQGVTREFRSSAGVVQVLRGVDLRVEPGEFIALRGRSGSGKTTLLNIMVGLDMPTQGRVLVLEHDLAKMHERERVHLRRKNIGILFQNAHLFPTLTAQENIEIPLRLVRMPSQQRIERAREALERVGLSRRAHHRGLELSGGEQQRVSLARALVHQPRFIVADEPTGNLDSLTGRDITRLLRDITHNTSIGMIVATHDPGFVASADRVLTIQDGRIADS